MTNAKGSHKIVYADDNMRSYLLRLTKQNQVVVNRFYMVGCEVLTNGVTAWFNNQPYHSAPLALNLVHNGLVKSMLGNDFSISVTNRPWEYSSEAKSQQVTLLGRLGLMLGLNVTYAMSIVSAFFVLSVVRVINMFYHMPLEFHNDIKTGTSKSSKIPAIGQRRKCLPLLGHILCLGLFSFHDFQLCNDRCIGCIRRTRLELSNRTVANISYVSCFRIRCFAIHIFAVTFL